ncbi:hypothetical protein HWV62_13591 [Athelia sp. TMB]|nr:hypothetical protein HWV62_13591 [Athelia sp. TMB]
MWGRARAVASALAVPAGVLACRPRPPSPEPPRAPSLASQRADDLPSYTSAPRDMAQIPYLINALPAHSLTTIHSATPTAVAVPHGHGDRCAPRAAQEWVRARGQMSQASLLDARSILSLSRTRGAGLPPADRAFLDALADAELPAPEIARIATLLALGPPVTRDGPSRAVPTIRLSRTPTPSQEERPRRYGYHCT